ncbi:hypothetical protein SK128_006881 [Halocaridina rubra]|uniref:Uncharacterized protein n=1 Tax=Halocaridina rubra TaxID=373956 RepID=A0AAN9AAF1_HALRR
MSPKCKADSFDGFALKKRNAILKEVKVEIMKCMESPELVNDRKVTFMNNRNSVGIASLTEPPSPVLLNYVKNPTLGQTKRREKQDSAKPGNGAESNVDKNSNKKDRSCNNK